jgi:hypothetical protein
MAIGGIPADESECRQRAGREAGAPAQFERYRERRSTRRAISLV